MTPLQRDMIALLPRLRRFARTLTRGGADADDLVQLTLERALRRSDQFRPGLRLDSWMYGIMKHAWIDELRASQRRPTGSDTLLALVPDVAEDGEAHVEALALRQELERLPPEQRLAVSLVLVEGFSYREAAEVAQIPEGTLTSRLARGRAALMAQLNAGDADGR